MKRLAILQSNYIPWRGYFDLIDAVDEFMLYDVVDFTRRDWRNRNQILTGHGPLWLTIPVLTKGLGRQAISAVEITGPEWAENHLKSIRHAYRRAPFFDDIEPLVADLYGRAATLSRLSEINRLFLHAICAEVGISTPIIDAADQALEDGATARLVGLCQAVGASHYVSGPAAQAYLDVDQFQAAGIELEYFSYAGYQPYPQMGTEFVSAVSILDTLFNVGPNTRDLLLGGGL